MDSNAKSVFSTKEEQVRAFRQTYSVAFFVDVWKGEPTYTDYDISRLFTILLVLYLMGKMVMSTVCLFTAKNSSCVCIVSK